MSVYKVTTNTGKVLLVKSDSSDNAMKEVANRGHKPVSVSKV